MKRALVCHSAFVPHGCLHLLTDSPQALRLRTMPPTLARRDILTLQPWRNSQDRQDRSHSTTHESSIVDTRESAILLGPKPTKEPQPSSNHDRSKGKQEMESPTETSKSKTPPPQNVAREAAVSGPNMEARGRQGSNRWEGGGSKRKAKGPDTRPSQRRRVAPPELKDVEFIQRTMHVPTQADYPDMPATFFTQFKHSLNNFSQRVGVEVERQFISPAPKTYQCTLTCNDLNLPTVAGDGSTKVGCCIATHEYLLTLSGLRRGSGNTPSHGEAA